MNPKLIKKASLHLEEMIRRDGINPHNSIFNVIVKVAQNPSWGSKITQSVKNLMESTIPSWGRKTTSEAAGQAAEETSEQVAKQVGEQAARQVAQQAPTVAKKGWGPFLRGALRDAGIGFLGGAAAGILASLDKASKNEGPFKPKVERTYELVDDYDKLKQYQASQQTKSPAGPEQELTPEAILQQLQKRKGQKPEP